MTLETVCFRFLIVNFRWRMFVTNRIKKSRQNKHFRAIFFAKYEQRTVVCFIEITCVRVKQKSPLGPIMFFASTICANNVKLYENLARELRNKGRERTPTGYWMFRSHLKISESPHTTYQNLFKKTVSLFMKCCFLLMCWNMGPLKVPGCHFINW